MVTDFYLIYIFLIPIAIIIVIYVIFRINLRKASQQPSRRRPTLLKYNRHATREVIFWPCDAEMPTLGRMLRADVVSDPQLGPLIMVIPSRLEFWLLCVLNLCFCVLCVDALLGGTLIMNSLTYRYFDLLHYKEYVAAIFILMFFWGFFNLYRASNKILFYEHGIMLMPRRNRKYDYNDIVEIDLVEKKKFGHKNIICRISFKNNRELLFDSGKYSKLKDKILFWKQNLVWTG